MKRPYRALRSAELELEDAADWYEQQGEGLSERLLDGFAHAIELARQMPRAGALVTSPTLRREVRRFKIESFPYNAIIAVFEHELVFVAFAHQRCKPGYWMPRLAEASR